GVIPISGVYRIHEITLNAGLAKSNGNGSVTSGAIQVRTPPFNSVFGQDAEVRKAASPLAHVRPGLPPFLVVYADRDLPTLPDMAREFDAALKDNHCDVRTLEVKSRNHLSVLLNSTKDDDPVGQAIAQFIAQHAQKAPPEEKRGEREKGRTGEREDFSLRLSSSPFLLPWAFRQWHPTLP